MKIIKHCRENLPELVTGQLLGLDFESSLEVTNCFPFPQRSDDDEEESEAEAGAEYQMEMMRSLREVNTDHNAVGWYTSTYLSYFPSGSINDQFKYQTAITKCVVLVYDPLQATQGQLALKAYRMTDAFMKLYSSNNFTHERYLICYFRMIWESFELNNRRYIWACIFSLICQTEYSNSIILLFLWLDNLYSLANSRLAFNSIFEEIPIKITNSHLLKAFLFDIESSRTIDAVTEFERLDLATNPFLEKNLEVLIQCVDDFSNEQNKYQNYQKNLARQQQYLNKKVTITTLLLMLVFTSRQNYFIAKIVNFA
jgi:translation initiation factor 3 subunit H